MNFGRKDNEPYKWYILQYQKATSNHLIHTVVRDEDIIWTTSNGIERSAACVGQVVYIREGPIVRSAQVLSYAMTQEEINEQYDTLKIKCYESMYSRPQNESHTDKHVWLLLQYNIGPTNTVYGIFNQSDIIMQKDNLYNDLVAYITDGDTVYQALKVRVSDDAEELVNGLYRLQHQASKFPLIKGEEKLQKFGAELEQFLRNQEHEQEASTLVNNTAAMASTGNIEEELQLLEERMHDESELIARAFVTVDRTKAILRRKLEFLNALMHFY